MYEINIIRSDFVESVSYGSRSQARFLGHNTYTSPGRICAKKWQFFYKIDFFNFIPQILSEKINNNLTIKAYCYPRVIDPAILKLFPEGSYESLYACNKSVITFGTEENIIGFYNTSHVYSRYTYSI